MIDSIYPDLGLRPTLCIVCIAPLPAGSARSSPDSLTAKHSSQVASQPTVHEYQCGSHLLPESLRSACRFTSGRREEWARAFGRARRIELQTVVQGGSVTLNSMWASCSGPLPILRRKGSQ